MSTLIASTLQSIDATTATTLKTGNTSAGLITLPSTGGIVLASNSTTNAVTVSASGNVGLGTSTPSYPLDIVSGSAQFPTALNIRESTHATSKRAGFFVGSWLFDQDINGNGTRDFGIYDSNAPATRFYINTAGNTGIGNTAPAQKLVVEGNMYANGVPLQMTYLRNDTKSTWSFATAGSTGTVITDLNSSITPRRTTSKILVTYCIAYEVYHDTVFQLYRNDGGANTKIGNNATDSNYWSGIWLPSYDAENSSTPRQATLMYLDSPATTNTCTYQLMIQSAGTGAGTFYLNRSVGSAGQANYEVAISQVFLQEIGQI
jgi:hypothetical protein